VVVELKIGTSFAVLGTDALFLGPAERRAARCRLGFLPFPLCAFPRYPQIDYLSHIQTPTRGSKERMHRAMCFLTRSPTLYKTRMGEMELWLIY
jgi:hypothetical protein